MKRVLIVLLVIISLYTIYKFNNRTLPVSIDNSVDINLDDYSVYYLDLSEEDIRTINLSKFIPKTVEIVSLTPYINPIYKNKIKSLKYSFRPNLSLKKNLNNFTNYYKDTIKEYGFLDDLNYINVDGIKILELELYAKGSDIINIMYVRNKIKYKTVLKNEYKYLEV